MVGFLTFFSSHIKNLLVLARLCLFPPRAGGVRAGGSLLELWDVPGENCCPQGHGRGCSRHPPNPAWGLLVRSVSLGAAGEEQDGAGGPGGSLQPSTKTWKPKPDVGCLLLSPNEADLGCLRTRGVQKEPSSTAGGMCPAWGAWGGLKAVVPMGTLTPGPRFPPAPVPGRQLP